MVFGALLVAISMVLSLVNVPVQAAPSKGQETCPDGGDWIKKDLPGNSRFFTYRAPAGYLIYEYCYKAATNVVYTQVDPPSTIVEIESGTKHDLSHISVRILIPTPTPETPIPEPTDTPVPTATDTPVPTATDTPVPTATDTPVPTATDTPVPTSVPPTSTPVRPTDTPPPDIPPTSVPPTNTPIPDIPPTDTPPAEQPSPTPDDPGATQTPSNDPPEEPTLPPPPSYDQPSFLIPVTGSEVGNENPLDSARASSFNLGLGLLGIGLVLKTIRKK